MMKISGRIVSKNSVINVIGLSLPSLVSIIILPLLINALDEARFGLFMLIWAIQGYLKFLSLRLGYSLIKYASEALYKKEENHLSIMTWTTMVLLGCLGSIGGLGLGIFALSLFKRVFQIPAQLWEEAQIALFLASISVLLTIITTGFRSLLAAGQRFDIINWIYATTASARYFLALLVALIGFHLPAIMLVLLFVDVIRFVGYLVFCLRLFPSIRNINVNFSLARPILWFGGWLSVSQIIGTAVEYIDRFIVSLLLPIVNLTYYAVPVEIVNRLLTFSKGLNQALFPALSAQARSKHAFRLFSHSIKFILLGTAPIVLILFFFGDKLLQLYLGKDIALHVIPVFQLLIIGFFFSSLGAIIHNYILALDKPDVVAKFHLVELPVYVGVALLLTSEFGIEGMALAWLLRCLLELGYVFFIFRLTLKKSVLSSIASNRMGRVVIAVSALSIFMLSLYLIPGECKYMRNILVAFIGILVYSIASWKYILDVNERLGVIGLVMSLGRKIK